MTATASTDDRPRSPLGSPFAAAALSALLPGLGQLTERRPLRALLWLVPVAATAVAALAVGAALVSGDPATVAFALIRPEILVALLALDVLLVMSRVGAAVDAYRIGRATMPRQPSDSAAGPRRRRWLGPLVLALVLAVTGSIHVGIAAGDLVALQVVTAVFDGGGEGGDEAILPPEASTDPSPSPDPSASPSPGQTAAPVTGSPTPAGSVAERDPSALGEPSPSPSPDPSPSPRPARLPAWASDGRLDILLVGTDAGPDRWKLRTDTMIVLSADVATGRAAMFGIPRNLVNVPLPDESAGAFACRCFPKQLNGLWVYADGHPKAFPGGKNRGWRAVAGAISTLIGRRLDGLVVVDLNGFVDAIDALGGLRIKVPELLVDERYPKPDGSGLTSIRIEPGWHTFDGEMALAYARSRHQDSDYGRMHRQQHVLLALRAQAKPCRMIPRLTSLLPVIQRSVWTTFKVKELPDLLELAARVNVRQVKSVTFTPSSYPSTLRPSDVERIQAVVGGIFRGKDTPAPAPIETLPEGC